MYTNRQIAAQVLLIAIDHPERKIESILIEQSHQWDLTSHEMQLIREEIDNLLNDQVTKDNA